MTRTDALRVTTRHASDVPGLDDLPNLLRHLPERDGAAWVRNGQGLVGIGQAIRLDAGTGPERFATTRDQIASLAASATVHDDVAQPGTGLVAFLSHTFAPNSTGSVAVVPRFILGRRGDDAWLTSIVAEGADPSAPAPPDLGPPPPPQDRPRFAGSSLPDLHWLVGVANAVERLQAGELEKVVLARDHALWARAPFQIRGVSARLAARFPDCFTFVVDGLVGATPELLLRRFGRSVAADALAGTARRGTTPDEDEALGQSLLTSDKIALEHRLAAQSVAAVLQEHCIRLEQSPPHLRLLDNLQHVATTFGGTLRRDEHLLDLVADLHPTAAVGGTPRDSALALISEVEGMDRGRYAGPVGWVDGNGDGEVGIALRCAELSGARARLFAGGGIVAGSLPEDELEETRIKLRAMQSVLGDT